MHHVRESGRGRERGRERERQRERRKDDDDDARSQCILIVQFGCWAMKHASREYSNVRAERHWKLNTLHALLSGFMKKQLDISNVLQLVIKWGRRKEKNTVGQVSPSKCLIMSMDTFRRFTNGVGNNERNLATTWTTVFVIKRIRKCTLAQCML